MDFTGFYCDTDFAIEVIERYTADARTKMIGRNFYAWRSDMELGLHPFWIGLMMVWHFNEDNVNRAMANFWQETHIMRQEINFEILRKFKVAC
jgi:hypothetical protein